MLIWAALPWIFTGMRIAVRYAFTTTLLAELIAANRGLGFLIELNSGNFNTTGAYAAIVVVVICSVLLTELLSRLESRISHRVQPGLIPPGRSYELVPLHARRLHSLAPAFATSDTRNSGASAEYHRLASSCAKRALSSGSLRPH